MDPDCFKSGEIDETLREMNKIEEEIGSPGSPYSHDEPFTPIQEAAIFDKNYHHLAGNQSPSSIKNGVDTIRRENEGEVVSPPSPGTKEQDIINLSIGRGKFNT